MQRANAEGISASRRWKFLRASSLLARCSSFSRFLQTRVFQDSWIALLLYIVICCDHNRCIGTTVANGLRHRRRITRIERRNKFCVCGEAITSNCHVQCAFPPNRIETAEHLSKLTGQTTVVKEQVTTSDRGWTTNVSRSTHEISRPLMTADESMRMRGALKDTNGLITRAGEMVVYVAGYPAIRGVQPLFFKDSELARRSRIPAPSIAK